MATSSIGSAFGGGGGGGGFRGGEVNILPQCSKPPGTIDTAMINETHKKIKEIVSSYKDLKYKVSDTTVKLESNWVGSGRNEFESQYNLLIRKIEDFGDTLEEIYDALVEAEAEYEEQDDSLRIEFVKAMTS